MLPHNHPFPSKKSHRLARMHGIQIFKADNAKRIWGDNWTHSQIILLNPIFETRNIITSRLSLQLCSPACFHRWGLSKRFSALVMWSGDDDDLIFDKNHLLLPPCAVCPVIAFFSLLLGIRKNTLVILIFISCSLSSVFPFRCDLE